MFYFWLNTVSKQEKKRIFLFLLSWYLFAKKGQKLTTTRNWLGKGWQRTSRFHSKTPLVVFRHGFDDVKEGEHTRIEAKTFFVGNPFFLLCVHIREREKSLTSKNDFLQQILRPPSPLQKKTTLSAKSSTLRRCFCPTVGAINFHGCICECSILKSFKTFYFSHFQWHGGGGGFGESEVGIGRLYNTNKNRLSSTVEGKIHGSTTCGEELQKIFKYCQRFKGLYQKVPILIDLCFGPFFTSKWPQNKSLTWSAQHNLWVPKIFNSIKFSVWALLRP